MTTSDRSSRRSRWAVVAGVSAIFLLGALALERASRSWVPAAERQVREAQAKSGGARGDTASSGSQPAPAASADTDPLSDASAKAAASPNDAAVQLDYARRCADIGAFMRALRPAQAAVRLDPANPQSQLLLGMLYASQGYLPDAEKCYQQAIELDPALLEAYLRLGQLLSSQDRAADEEALYRKAMKVAPSSEGPRMSLAGFLSAHGRNEEALTYLEPALNASDPNPAALLLASKSFQSLGKVDRAEDLLRKLVQQKPDLADGHHLLGSVLSNRGALKEGIEHLHRAAELDPENATYWYALGNALRSDSAHPEALQLASQAFERSLEINPAFPFAHYFYGLTLENLGDRDSAVREYRRTLELDPKFGSARHRLGTVYKELGKTAEGEKLLAQFAQEARGAITQVHGGRRENSFLDTAQAQYDRGMKFLQKGERQKAILAFKNALVRDPQFGLARRQLRMMGETTP